MGTSDILQFLVYTETEKQRCGEIKASLHKIALILCLKQQSQAKRM